MLLLPSIVAGMIKVFIEKLLTWKSLFGLFGVQIEELKLCSSAEVIIL